MALDADSVAFTTWADSDVAEGVRFGQSKFERMAQNQIAFDNRLNQQGNAWNLGSDVWDHFAAPNDATAANVDGVSVPVFHFYGKGGLFRDSNDGGDSTNWTSGAHVLEIDNNAQWGGIFTAAVLQPDEASVLFEARVYNETDTNNAIGLCGVGVTPCEGTQTTLTAASPGWGHGATLTGAWFIKGSTTGTWDAVTYESGTERERTASLSGTNYTTWDELRIELDATSARFYVYDGSSWVLKATHTTQIAAIAATAMRGMVAPFYVSLQASMFVDYFRFGALSNSTAT